MNVCGEPLELPAGKVLLRSRPGGSAAAGYAPEDMSNAGHPLGSGETVWLEMRIEDTES
ncbi:hypothetical protein AHiyo6_29680 [Arthrobacter sp. Hiyo6]|nr:hypothetical protein AHiyo6_29680 [Arthrobacter sp. Hiyo6]